jgi:hypothetical protein
MKLLYKPFGVLFGILAGIIGRQTFKAIWSHVDDEEPPKATTELAPWQKVLAAAFLQGAIFAVVKALVERSGAKGFAHLTGIWPGERRPDPE